jgi:hypothetical protein
LWAQKDYSIKTRIIIAMSASIMAVIFWYDYSSIQVLAIAPFLSGLIALLISNYIEYRPQGKIK